VKRIHIKTTKFPRKMCNKSEEVRCYSLTHITYKKYKIYLLTYLVMYKHFTVTMCSTPCPIIILRWLLDSDAIKFIFFRLIFIRLVYSADTHWLHPTQSAKIIFTGPMCFTVFSIGCFFHSGDSCIFSFFLVLVFPTF